MVPEWRSSSGGFIASLESRSPHVKQSGLVAEESSVHIKLVAGVLVLSVKRCLLLPWKSVFCLLTGSFPLFKEKAIICFCYFIFQVVPRFSSLFFCADVAVYNVDTLFINKRFHMSECFHLCCLLACGFSLAVTNHVTETGAFSCVKSSAIDGCNRENLVIFQNKIDSVTDDK